MRILMAGTPETSVCVVNTILEQPNTQIVGVLCPFPKPVGREQVLTECALAKWAEERHIPVFQVNREVLHGPELYRKLPTCDMLVVADFGFLVPQFLLDVPRLGSYNIHPSLLPRWRGASPVPFTILFGDQQSGVSVIRMNAKFDEGAVVLQQKSPVLAEETSPELLFRLFALGAELLATHLDDILHNRLVATPQPPHSPTPLTRKFSREDGHIPLASLKMALQGHSFPATVAPPLLIEYKLPLSPLSIHRCIRALDPWPGTWTTLANGKRLKLLQANMEGARLQLQIVQLEGKQPVPFQATQFSELFEPNSAN